MVAAGVLLAIVGGRSVGLAGLAAVQLAIIGGVPVAFSLARHRRRVAAALGLHAPSARAIAGALLCGGSFWYLNWQLVAPLGEWLFGNRDELRHLEAAVTTAPLVWVLLAVAVVPAVCEELLMRGLILRALRPRIGAALAVVASAVLFSLLHLTLIQLLPTLAFGLLLGYATVHSGVVSSMLMHLVNNAMALFLATTSLGSRAADPGAGLLLFPAAAFFCIVGLVLLRSRTNRSGST